MRGLIVLSVMTMFVAGVAQGGWNDYEEIRELTLDSDGVETLSIDAGAGSMDVTGEAGLDAIRVKALIVVPNANESKAQRVIDERMVLSLERQGADGHLKSWFESGFLGFGSDAHIALDIRVPLGMHVRIDDSGGSIEVIGTQGDLSVDDSSGSVFVSDVGNVMIDDGSGSIKVLGADGDVSIVDGSGSITVERVSGSVTVDDGSGSINVSDVEHDFVVLDDGSGSVRHSDVRGTVSTES